MRPWILPASAFALALSVACSSSDDSLPDVGGNGNGQNGSSAPSDNLNDMGVGGDEAVADDTAGPNPDDVQLADDPIDNPYADAVSDLEDMTNVGPNPEEMPGPPPDVFVDAPDAPDPPEPVGGYTVDPVEATTSASGTSETLPRTAPTNPAWLYTEFECPHNPLDAKCVCRGSPYNCQLPNNQPGRNRYLPPPAIHELNQTTVLDTRQQIIARIGRWDADPTTPIFDGRGTALGNVTNICYVAHDSGSSVTIDTADTGHPCVKVNFGIVKHMKTPFDPTTDGRYVFAYDATVHTPDGADLHTGGWIPLSKVVSDKFHPYNTPPRKPSRIDETALVLKAAEDYGCSSSSYNPATCLPSWTRLKIAPNSHGASFAAYLLRAGNMQTIAYNTPRVGGVATDGIDVTRPNGVQFARAHSVDAQHATILGIGLYQEGSTVRVATKYFYYGRVAGRWGWVPQFALKKGLVTAPPDDDAGGGQGACSGRADGIYCNPLLPFSAFVCVNQQVASTKSCPNPNTQHCIGPNAPPDPDAGPDAAPYDIQCQ